MSRDLTPQGLPVGWSDSSLAKGGSEPVFGGGCLLFLLKLMGILILASIGLTAFGQVAQWVSGERSAPAPTTTATAAAGAAAPPAAPAADVPPVPLQALAVGRCYWREIDAQTVRPTSCTDSHDGEVAAVVPVAADGAPSGTDAITQCSQQVPPALSRYLATLELVIAFDVPPPGSSGNLVCLVERGEHEPPLSVPLSRYGS